MDAESTKPKPAATTDTSERDPTPPCEKEIENPVFSAGGAIAGGTAWATKARPDSPRFVGELGTGETAGEAGDYGRMEARNVGKILTRQQRFIARKRRAGWVRIEMWVPGTWVAHVREKVKPSIYAGWVLEQLYEARQKHLQEQAEREVMHV